jgi:hypothetical protein
MIGPAEQISIGGGKSADLYLLRFDEHGRLQSPQTAQLAVEAAKSASDVFFFSHGWNNIYIDALTRYRDFTAGFVAQRAALGLPVPANYSPLLIGVIWPATWFVLESEEGPDIAAGGVGGPRYEQMLAEVVGGMPDDKGDRLTELLDGRRLLSKDSAVEAAELVRSALWATDDTDAAAEPPDVAAMLSSWQAIGDDGQPYVDEDETIGTVGAPADQAVGGGTEPEAQAADEPENAGLFGFDPRDLLRMGSVWRMKARAGTVGTYGVAPVLTRLLETKARIHLAGHSFGARVVLSAMAAQPISNRAYSMLLLQPAVNRWCFAENVALTGQVGGYRTVIDRVERPIISTMSSADKPLHEFFHLAVRGGSLGEVDTAAIGDTERYGALGGYGPVGLGALMREHPLPILAPGTRYDLSGPARVLAVDGSARNGNAPAISGHGDISNRYTWWALHNLVDPLP